MFVLNSTSLILAFALPKYVYVNVKKLKKNKQTKKA